MLLQGNYIVEKTVEATPKFDLFPKNNPSLAPTAMTIARANPIAVTSISNDQRKKADQEKENVKDVLSQSSMILKDEDETINRSNSIIEENYDSAEELSNLGNMESDEEAFIQEIIRSKDVEEDNREDHLDSNAASQEDDYDTEDDSDAELSIYSSTDVDHQEEAENDEESSTSSLELANLIHNEKGFHKSENSQESDSNMDNYESSSTTSSSSSSSADESCDDEEDEKSFYESSIPSQPVPKSIIELPNPCVINVQSDDNENEEEDLSLTTYQDDDVELTMESERDGSDDESSQDSSDKDDVSEGENLVDILSDNDEDSVSSSGTEMETDVGEIRRKSLNDQDVEHPKSEDDHSEEVDPAQRNHHRSNSFSSSSTVSFNSDTFIEQYNDNNSIDIKFPMEDGSAALIITGESQVMKEPPQIKLDNLNQLTSLMDNEEQSMDNGITLKRKMFDEVQSNKKVRVVK